MKKKIVLISVLCVVLFVVLLQTRVLATSNKLEKIVEKFNNSVGIKELESLLQTEYKATTSEENPNVLEVTITTGKESSAVSYELEGNILSNTNLVDDNVITAYLLADSVGQVNGYSDGEVMNSFNMFAKEYSNYTVENEGFELNNNNNSYSAKIDITKKIPLIDEDEYYLKPDDFDMIKEFVEKGTSGNQSGRKAKFAYNIEAFEDESHIYIGEKDEITESTYKSIISAIEVIYGTKVVDYFKSIYPDFSEGSVIVDGFSIEKDIDIDLEENPMYTGTKVVLVTINNDFVKDEILRTEYIGETIERGEKEINLDFTQNKSFKLGFFDSVNSSDVGFLYKYILEPVFMEAGAEVDDKTAYFNIVNNKIVVGDKNNSIFKIEIGEESLEILPTITDSKITTITAKHENTKAKEYEEGKTQDHFRYGNYNVIVNVKYGKEEEKKSEEIKNDVNPTPTPSIEKKAEPTSVIEKKTDTKPETSTKSTSKKETNKTNNPKTGDNIMIYIVLFVISFVGMAVIIKKSKLKCKK